MRGQRGFLLIDVLVGLAIVGLITVAFLSGLTTALKAVSLSQERVSVESLVKSQIEYIKTQAYVAVDDYSPDDPDNRYEVIVIPDLAAAGYSVELIDMNPPPTILSEAGGYELQKITVAVKRDGQAKLVVSIYRVSD